MSGEPILNAEKRPVSVTCTAEITDDVLAGLRVYAEVVRQPVSQEVMVNRWLRWNRDNPYGPGVFVVAKDGARAVGMYAVIPMRMRVAGQLITGGKGEYQAVLPEYLRAIDQETGGYLPTAMVQRAFAQAAQSGMRVIQTFPTEVARFSVYRAGGRPVNISGHSHFAFLRSCNLERSGKSRIDPRLLTLGGTIATSLLRTSSLFSRRGLRRKLKVTPQQPPLALEKTGARNQFLAEEMLPFRYPAEDYLTVTVESNRGRAQLIFTRPQRSAVVRISHWSPYALDPTQWAAGIDEVVRIARKAGAGGISIRIPDTAPTEPRLFRSLGFFPRGFQDAMFLYSGEPELAASCVKDPWAPTNSHIGLYTYS